MGFGVLFIMADSGDWAMVSVIGGTQQTAIHASRGVFDTALGTASSYNVAYSAANTAYCLENRVGGTVGFTVSMIGRS